MTGAFDTLIETIASFYGNADPPSAPLVRVAIADLEACRQQTMRILEPRTLPVCRYLPACLMGAHDGPLADIASALGSVAGQSRWTQNPNYTEALIGTTFLANYGYLELVGANGLWPSDRTAVGVLLLGPETHYPRHHHPAAEVYHVISGTAQWWREDRDWARKPPGSAIIHRPHIRHATRAEAEPLLVLYCWSGDINVAAKLD